jgi:hypothetical protein
MGSSYKSTYDTTYDLIHNIPESCSEEYSTVSIGGIAYGITFILNNAIEKNTLSTSYNSQHIMCDTNIIG